MPEYPRSTQGGPTIVCAHRRLVHVHNQKTLTSLPPPSPSPKRTGPRNRSRPWTSCAQTHTPVYTTVGLSDSSLTTRGGCLFPHTSTPGQVRVWGPSSPTRVYVLCPPAGRTGTCLWGRCPQARRPSQTLLGVGDKRQVRSRDSRPSQRDRSVPKSGPGRSLFLGGYRSTLQVTPLSRLRLAPPWPSPLSFELELPGEDPVHPQPPQWRDVFPNLLDDTSATHLWEITECATGSPVHPPRPRRLSPVGNPRPKCKFRYPLNPTRPAVLLISGPRVTDTGLSLRRGPGGGRHG